MCVRIMENETDKHTEIEELKLEIEQLKTANKCLQDRIDVLTKLLET